MSISRAGTLHFEQEDANYSGALKYSMQPGETFIGSIGEGDRADAVQVSLVAGETYTIALDSFGANGLANPIMRVNFNGSTIAVVRDGGEGNNALYTFTAKETGNYDILSLGIGRTGDYKISVSGGPEPTPAPAPEPVVVTEEGDAAYSPNTTASVNVGEVFKGAINPSYDRDAIAVELEEGGSYTFTLKGVGENALGESILSLFSAQGSRVAREVNVNENGDVEITVTAPASGKYFLGVAGRPGSSGDYELSVVDNNAVAEVQPSSPTLPAGWWSNDQIAGYLTDGYWGTKGYDRAAFDVKPGGAITINLDDVQAINQGVIIKALEAWTAVTGVGFDVVKGDAQITYSDQSAGAYAYSDSGNGEITSAFVNVSAWWIGVNGRDLGSYAYQTVIHETGHALGLGHAGNYNGAAKYGVNNEYPNDSFQTTVMSYFDQGANTAISADKAYLATPMVADILAMQDLYGVAGDLRTEDTVYGENSTAGGNYDGIADAPVAFTILDDGGHDTINFSSVTADQKISLISESYSDVNGLKGNMAIMRGTVIEDAYSGSGNDRLIGNHVDNALYANAGDDILEGAAGNDVLSGGAGSDKFIFNAQDGSDEIIDFEDGLDLIVFDSGAQSMDDLNISQDGNNTCVAYEGGMITLTNIDMSLITQDDFMFV